MLVSSKCVKEKRKKRLDHCSFEVQLLLISHLQKYDLVPRALDSTALNLLTFVKVTFCMIKKILLAVSINGACWIKIIIAEQPYKLYKIFYRRLKAYLKYFQMTYIALQEGDFW